MDVGKSPKVIGESTPKLAILLIFIGIPFVPIWNKPSNLDNPIERCRVFVKVSLVARMQWQGRKPNSTDAKWNERHQGFKE